MTFSASPIKHEIVRIKHVQGKISHDPLPQKLVISFAPIDCCDPILSNIALMMKKKILPENSNIKMQMKTF